MANEIYHRPGQSSDIATPLVPKVFSNKLLSAMYDNQGVWQHFINFTADVQNGEESVSVPILPHTAAVDVSFTDGTYTNQQITPIRQTITIDQWKAVPYRIVESVIRQSNINVEDELAKNGAKSVAEAIDEEILELVSGFTTNEVSTATAAMTELTLTKAMEKLMNQRLKFNNPMDFVWIFHNSVYHQIKSQPYFAAQYYTGEAFGGSNSNAQIDAVFKIPCFFYGSSYLEASGSVVFSGLFHREAIGVAIQSEPRYLEKEYVDSSLAKEYVVECMFGVKELRDAYGCRIQTLSTADPS